MADTNLFDTVQKLQAICLFAADIVPTDESLYADLGWRSGRGLEADRTEPVFSYERVLAAVALYRMNPSLKIIPSGGCTNLDEKKSPPISSVIAFELEQLGVPRDAIIEESLAENTQGQLQHCSAIVRAHWWPAYRIAILAPFWQFGRIVAMIANKTDDVYAFQVGVTHLLSMERALATEDAAWNTRFAEWYAMPEAREMFAMEALGAGQLWAGHQPKYPNPFRGFPDPLAQ